MSPRRQGSSGSSPRPDSVAHGAQDLAVVRVALALARGGHDAHRAVAAARVVDGDLRQAQAHLLVDVVEGRQVEPRLEVHERSAVDAAHLHALASGLGAAW
jgi:hypothetical protein